MASARNVGLDAATGDYVAFLDQDDIWLKTLTQQHIDYICENYYDMISFSMYCSNKNINRVRSEYRDDGVYDYPFWEIPMHHHSSYFYRTEFLRKNGIYTDRYHGIDFNFRNEDTRFLIQCYAKATRIRCFSDFLFVYRNNPGSVVHTAEGRGTLITTLKGFRMLAEFTENDSIRSTCYYTTRYFLELLEIISLDYDAEKTALLLYKQFEIDKMIEDGFASGYSKAYYALWRDHPNEFWQKNRKKERLLRFKALLGKQPLIRTLYHLKKYPESFHGLKYC